MKMFGFYKKNFFDSKYVPFNEMESLIFSENNLRNDCKKEIEQFLINQLRKIDVKIMCKVANQIINLSRITDFTPKPPPNDCEF